MLCGRFVMLYVTHDMCWLNLQGLYELRLAERKAGKATKGLPTLKQRAQDHAHA